ncbi:hypothetical protein [Allorhizobium borbori]|uniref:Uncharacterized protein n=1 Tax=Allorhizobium borbori TaxID=485907 RepID=A0A7W6K3H7_9HYPH|nr:hypothetical protein [Allorhizobium borbori]MBB4103576.1 hypothetical protein [Allorhizobium borbori]
MSDENKKTARKKTWIEKAQARDKWLPLSILAVAIGTFSARNGGLFANSGGLIDSTLLVAFIALLAWLFWPSSKSDDAP